MFLCVSDFNNRNQYSTAKLLKQDYRYYKIRITFSKFYNGLKTLLQQGTLEPVFYGDLVYERISSK